MSGHHENAPSRCICKVEQGAECSDYLWLYKSDYLVLIREYIWYVPNFNDILRMGAGGGGIAGGPWLHIDDGRVSET